MSNKTNLGYHIVLVTKYRKSILTPSIMDFLIDKIKQKLTETHCNVIAIQGDDMNHIHILVKLKPTQSISLLIKLIKQITTYYVWQEYPVYLRRHYWYNNYLWSSGYFCGTIGDASEKTIKQYIENQG